MTQTAKAAHTPTPWKASPPDGSYHDVIRIYAVDGKEGDLPVAVCCQRESPFMQVLTCQTNETTEAACNAAFIVRAVNAHDEMLRWLTWALPFAERFAKDHNDSPTMESCIEQARAAIARAAGGGR